MTNVIASAKRNYGSNIRKFMNGCHAFRFHPGRIHKHGERNANDNLIKQHVTDCLSFFNGIQ